MSRLYLIIFLLISNFSYSQDEVGKWIEFADEQYSKGDFYYALEYYTKAMNSDSNSIVLLWKYAETHRAYKDYKKAEYYYNQIYLRDQGQLYPNTLLFLGLMQKQNGHYELAMESFKKGKRFYSQNKKDYPYIKCKREIESLSWVKSALKDTAEVVFNHLPETINSKDSEFGHIIHNNQLIFSSLKADSILSNEEVYSMDYKTRIYKSDITPYGYDSSEIIKDLIIVNRNTGNGAFSLDGNRFYFSSCINDGYNYRCKIMVARYGNGMWSDLDSLGEIINDPNSNNTMPTIGEIDGEEVLFFTSDRKESLGGLDIWYSKIRNGNQYSKPKPIKSINSVDNETTPWWSPEEKRLYFSSSWHDGFGGTDVFYSEYTTQFTKPINIGLPFNSPANDIYYFKVQDTAYITSNREGVFFSKNPTCCSDIFQAIPIIKETPPTPKETLAELNKRLPVTLYFHNDVPDPRSKDSNTLVNYINSYHDYREMLETYKKEYSDGLSGSKSEDAKEDIESFFIEYVDQGVKDLELFRNLLLEELEKGSKIKITVKGFASPLAKTDYNVNLTKRRINSLINYLNEYENGVFRPYLNGSATNGGQVVFAQVPFGEYTANKLTSDNLNDLKNSVYSRAAAIERKIEIQSINYMDTLSPDIPEEENVISITSLNQLADIGKRTIGEKLKTEYIIKNTSNKTIEMENIEIPCDCLEASIESKTLKPGEETVVTLEFNTEKYKGLTVKSIYLKVKGEKGKLRLVMTTELFD
jgi:tetratricopeptide (TPR) repeat protein